MTNKCSVVRGRRTALMKIATDDLKMDELLVIYPGRKEYPLGESIRVLLDKLPLVSRVEWTTLASDV